MPSDRSRKAHTIVVEVGGGSTEVLVVRNGDVIFSHTYRLGSLRLRQTLESYGAPAGKVRSIMQNQIQRTVDEVVAPLPTDAVLGADRAGRRRAVRGVAVAVEMECRSPG